MGFKDYLKTMAGHDASELYLGSGAPASVKINGSLTVLYDRPLS